MSIVTDGQRYRVGPMVSNANVHWALDHRYRSDPEYVKAVIQSYIDVKVARGRSKFDIEWKLNVLESELPQYADAFRSVRQQRRLAPSRVLPEAPPLPRTQSVRNPPNPRVSRTNTTPARPRPPMTVRPAEGESDEPPPPPYTRQDPEPEQTRMLQEHLAAESASSPATPTTATPVRPSSISSARPTPLDAARRTPPVAARRTPPAAIRSAFPGPQPEDPEMARVWEESQFEEAKRMSIAAERERQELEEAMRLSLAETPGIDLSHPAAGPSSMPPVFEDESMPGSRRVSSYAPPSSAPPLPHRRVASDAAGPRPDLEPMSRLSLEQSNILDDGESIARAPMTPQKTGAAVLQSNNPFLSPAEASRSTAIRQASKQSLRESPGSSRTAYSSAEIYEPPPGPPPPRPRSSPLPPVAAATHASATLPATPSEDPLETLRDLDTIFLGMCSHETELTGVDDSTSMAGERWTQARHALMEVAEIAARYDENGVDVYFVNSKRVGRDLKEAAEVEDLFRGLDPKGSTPTGLRLEAILRDYMNRLERSTDPPVKPMNLIVITDGAFAHPVCLRSRQIASQMPDRLTLLQSAPTDDPESVLAACARRLDRGDYPLSQLGVQFLQIGDDAEAREALQELDDGLFVAHGVRDMVDTVPFSGEQMSADLIIKTLLGGINRRLDRR